MLILDEQLQNPDIIVAIEKWYPGAVTHILRLRPNSVIKDDNIATLLHAAQRPTFVTINVNDFWRKIQAHSSYCIIAMAIHQDEWPKVSTILRSVLNIPQLKTRANRMGKVILARESGLKYYEENNQVYDLPGIEKG
ncbi:MAG: hypothetical protein AAF702_13920 [Chloroflexota bacterium]